MDIQCVESSLTMLNGDRAIFSDREIGTKRRVGFVIILERFASGILRVVGVSIMIIVHSILTLGHRIGLIIVIYRAAAEVIRVVCCAIMIIIHSVIAFYACDFCVDGAVDIV